MPAEQAIDRMPSIHSRVMGRAESMAEACQEGTVGGTVRREVPMQCEDSVKMPFLDRRWGQRQVPRTLILEKEKFKQRHQIKIFHSCSN
jgi:hypothetical protein